MEERNYCVYKHTSPSGKVYIGITKQTANCRWKNGNGYKSSPHFWNAIQKYGWENFSHEILFSGMSVEDACNKEKQLIEFFRASEREFGYNERSGGQQGSLHSDEVRAKISAARKRYFAENPTAREEAAQRKRGEHWSAEQREKYIAAKKGKHLEISPEWRKKMTDGLKKRYAEDAELREEASNRMRQYGKSRSKPVLQLDVYGTVIASFESAHDAERKTGITNGNILKCCNGASKTAGGYKWQFASLYNSGRETA